MSIPQCSHCLEVHSGIEKCEKIADIRRKFEPIRSKVIGFVENKNWAWTPIQTASNHEQVEGWEGELRNFVKTRPGGHREIQASELHDKLKSIQLIIRLKRKQPKPEQP